jgi:hypothetical protein
MHRFRNLALLIQHWAAMAAGRSYWHLPQPLGAHFTPWTITGYFNDLRRKTEYSGKTDAEGFPLLTLSSGKEYYHPTCLLQKALGHWDISLKNAAGKDRTEAVRLANKLIDLQDDRGGWPFNEIVSEPLASPYSAMTQGQAISLFVRIAKATDDKRYKQAAIRSLDLLLTPTSSGGPLRHSKFGPIFEEFSTIPPNTILNGWVFAIFGLHDFLVMEARPSEHAILEATCDCLAKMLPEFVDGWWSRYDTNGNISSPLYQNLHVAQLQALEIVFPRLEYQEALATLQRQTRSFMWKNAALAIKVYQKLRWLPTITR